MPVVDHVRIHPAELRGSVTVPGDKSLSHRALILGALVGRPVAVAGLAPSGDVASTAAALRSMGATVELHDAGAGLGGTVTGPLAEPSDVLDCGNSGTSLRLLAGVAAGIVGMTVLTGDDSLRRRPVDRVRTPLEAMGARIQARAEGRLPPLVVHGGGLRGRRYDSPHASAQVKTCVLLAGLRADGPTTVVSPLRSRDHTERMLGYLGLPVDTIHHDDGREEVRLAPGPLRPRPIDVSGDPSSAAFWLVAGTLGTAPITTPGVCVNPGRAGILTTLRALGADLEVEARGDRAGEPVADISAGPARLTGGLLEGVAVVDALDELPILALAGAMSRDGLEVRDAAELRVKESDRIATIAAALGALGIAVEERADGYRVAGGQRPASGSVDARGDHRIAMTAAIAGVFATGPVDITGFHAVSTSYPGFLDDLVALGGEVEVLAVTP